MEKIYSDDKRYCFVVVAKIPYKHHIWNVNKDTLKGYIPLITLSGYQDFEGGRNIDTTNMKAIKCEDYVQIMENLYLKKDIENTEKWAKDNETDKKYTWEINRIKKSLPLIKKLNGYENIIN